MCMSGVDVYLLEYLLGLSAMWLVTESILLGELFGYVGARCSSVVRAFAHGAMGRRIDPSWWTH